MNETERYSIEALLWAAECIERRDKAEHGYAASVPNNHAHSKKLLVSKPSKRPQGSRCTHNELEKNRRAHLRTCLERLKNLTPVGGDTSRHTTLGLLTKARTYIKMLEEQDRRAAMRREHLMREQRLLRLRIEEVTKDSYRGRGERSFSECSAATNTSSACSSGASSLSELVSDTSADSEEIDILGESDSDDGLTSGSRPIPRSGLALSDHRYGMSESF